MRNLKRKVASESNIGPDDIFNLHQLAYEECDFVHVITTYPDLTCVVGSTDMLKHLKQLISHRQNVVLSYDTTFSVGEFYISPLLFRNPLFEGDPVMPVLFLIHERKLTSSHEALFKVLVDHCGKMSNIPILTDMEAGIIRAIESNCNSVN